MGQQLHGMHDKLGQCMEPSPKEPQMIAQIKEMHTETGLRTDGTQIEANKEKTEEKKMEEDGLEVTNSDAVCMLLR